MFGELEEFGNHVVEWTGTVYFDVHLAGVILAGFLENVEGCLKCQVMRRESEWQEGTRANLLHFKDWGIEEDDELLETFWPVFRFQCSKKGDDVLSCSVSNHERGIVKGLEDGLFDICDDFWSSAENETSVVLEEITSDGTDAILLVWHRCEDVCEIGDVVWCTGVSV